MVGHKIAVRLDFLHYLSVRQTTDRVIMKHFMHFLLFSSLFFASCSRQGNALIIEQLNEIKAMGDTLPKVAMQRLDSIKPLFENETEYMRNKLSLLDIRLNDKAYIKHTSIKPIKEVCSYFDKNGTTAEQQEAYYYMASVYRDLNDYPNAVIYFLKSAEVAENNNDIDGALWENAYSQLSYIYNQQFNYNNALDAAIKALDIAKKFNTVNERTYMSVANCYSEFDDTLQTIRYTDLALELIEKKGICARNAGLVASAMDYYSVYGYNEKAELCYYLLKQLQKDLRPLNYLVNIGIYYEHFVSADSAAVAMEELYITSNSIESKYDAARWLTRYFVANGVYEKAVDYAIKFINANEAVIDKRTLEHTTNAKNIFQYRRDKEEELEIMQKAAKDRFYLTVVVLVAIIILLGGTGLYYYRKKRLLDIILEKENSIKEIHVLIEQKNCELIAGKDEVERKQKELELLAEKNSNLAMQLQGAKSDFKMLIAQNSELTKLTLMNNISCDAKEIINKVKNASVGKYRLNDDEWKELFGAIDKLYPDFTYEVQAKFKKIGEPLLRVCYLLKIGLSGPQIVNLTDYPRQTVWDRIKRVEKVITFNPVGLPSQQDSQD